jgi:heme/copper-type cytochrome/quinol oxidase subunit 2
MEKSFFYIVGKLGFLFALISLIIIIFLGLFSYERINDIATDKIINPVIELSKYQNPIGVNIKPKPVDISPKKPKLQDKLNFTKTFNAQINRIISNFKSLPKNTLSQADLQFKIKAMIEINVNTYSQTLKLNYVKSLEILTKQLVNVGDKVDINDFLHWYDKEFEQQVQHQTQQNLLKVSTAKIDQMAVFMALGMVAIALGFFIMFVMMLAMLRIEKNTRK